MASLPLPLPSDVVVLKVAKSAVQISSPAREDRGCCLA